MRFGFPGRCRWAVTSQPFRLNGLKPFALRPVRKMVLCPPITDNNPITVSPDNSPPGKWHSNLVFRWDSPEVVGELSP
jgi:hypothetical protein